MFIRFRTFCMFFFFQKLRTEGLPPPPIYDMSATNIYFFWRLPLYVLLMHLILRIRLSEDRESITTSLDSYPFAPTSPYHHGVPSRYPSIYLYIFITTSLDSYPFAPTSPYHHSLSQLWTTLPICTYFPLPPWSAIEEPIYMYICLSINSSIHLSISLSIYKTYISFLNLFRHNRFGYPVFPEKEFGLASPTGS